MTNPVVGPEFEKPLVEMEARLVDLRRVESEGGGDVSGEIRALEEKQSRLKREIFGALTPAQRVQVARHPRRPYTLDYIGAMIEDFTELHGDRGFGDDPAIVAGIGRLGKWPVAVVGHQKGRSTQENMKRNFGMPHPEGYRKALRVMRMAAKFGRPIITFIDTPGAYPGLGAEERGQAGAIALNLEVMASLEVPIVAVVIGEGGSGGALAIGVADRILILEHAIYSVISPEGCASILWRDTARAVDAAAALKLTAPDLLRLGVADEIIPEPLGGAHRDPAATAAAVRAAVVRHLAELRKRSGAALVNARYKKYRAIGVYAKR
ncbi:MAG: acetyl-CoA carboxylase carboxyltransferase subunit alpha [bacterium]|mgnify:FL=1